MFHNSTNLFFRTGNIAFLTKHKKELLVSPILEPFLGVKVVHIDSYDTDSLGTFTRDIPRVDFQLDTARKKAKIGMEIGSLSMGIGSEGSFTTDPYYGLMPWNIEMLVFIDSIHNLEIVGMAEGPAKILQKTGKSIDEVEKIAKDFGFPENHLVIRPDTIDNPLFIKNISSLTKLRTGVQHCLQNSITGVVHIENDLRAYACPSRQEMIKLATINLLLKMNSFCPQCNTPGYWVTDIIKGLPCQYCHLPTDILKSQIYSCQKCSFTKEIVRTDLKYAGQESCNFCNP